MIATGFTEGLVMVGVTIRQRVTVKAKPVEVYEAFVDADKHSEFTGSRATGRGEVGAEFTAWDGYISGRVLELEEGKRLVQEWMTTEWPEGYPPSRFELTFRDIEGGTEVSMVHSGIPEKLAEDIGEGWKEYYWKPLKSYFRKLSVKRT